ncbi:hypothetical protein [Ferrimonas sp. SCSIO 43195]|uniref:hypothetical protein n=1 Tax=Ferrimonas sp. SCSIO 43195 TaxID=2822844 RepID=UPI002076521B|nr:hypothetical protein [Ferrimonas sp. SCSIO 43195]USD36093.1 hypothetical protein J8Z22_13725 [Ferrimonas sp. SCSIO 43195]
MRMPLLFSVVVGLALNSPLAQAVSCDAPSEATLVSAVYPTADRLPENLLRFYVYFSAPMDRGDILKSVYLADAQGNRQQGVFLDNKFDLWSPDSRRLTLLFDPGRVKTGLVAHNAMGRALTPGKHYQLVVETSAYDAKGCPLGSRFVKSFFATEADYQTPDVDGWQISQLQPGTSNPLTIDFDGKMDHVSLAYRIRLKDDDGNTVPGRIELAKQEQQWLFFPASPWGQRAYQLAVEPVLEDVAGNRIAGLFDQPSLARESAATGQVIAIAVDLKD